MKFQTCIWKGTLVAGVLFCIPELAAAKIVINEIAWMGTSLSANAEWIELANDSDAAESLDGFSLEAADGSPKIALKGSIAAKGFFLLERTSDASVPEASADQIYSGSLGNDGELLVLKNASAAEVDRVDGSSGWKISGDAVAGNNTTKETAQRTSAGWITAAATPRTANAVAGTPPVSPTEDQTQIATTSPETAVSASPSSSSISNTLSAHSEPVRITAVKEEIEFSVGAGRERLATIGTALSFKALSEGSGGRLATYEWTFGDGAREQGSSVFHAYLFPGDYNVVLRAEAGADQAVARTRVRVVDPKFQLSVPAADQALLKNNASVEVNVGGWSLVAGSRTFVFPPDTILGARAAVSFPRVVTGLDASEGAALFTPLQTLVVATERFSAYGASSSPLAVAVQDETILHPDSPQSAPEEALAQPESIWQDRVKELEQKLAAFEVMPDRSTSAVDFAPSATSSPAGATSSIPEKRAGDELSSAAISLSQPEKIDAWRRFKAFVSSWF